MNMELTEARLAVLEEISYKREQELEAIREFALYERQALAAAASSPSSSSKKKEEERVSAGDEGKENAAAAAAARSNALELQRLRIEMAQVKGERDMLKSHYQQEIMINLDACNATRKKQLMAEAAFVIGILDV